MIVTRDKDLAQLVRDGDHYWDYAGERRFAYEDIAAQFGVRPERMADYLALTGDSVDNIPGVPGVGPKTAAALLATFASLEELYDGLDRVGSLPIRGATEARRPASRTSRGGVLRAQAHDHRLRHADRVQPGDAPSPQAGS